MTKANPTVVGGFVVGAIALLIAGVIFFGSASMFAPKIPVVMVFPDSVEGLSTGSSIEFSGVQLGTVTSVTAIVQADLSIQIVVRGNIDPSAISLGAGVAAPQAPGEYFQQFVDKGLRAQLNTGSILTGQKIVSLVVRPDTPAVLLSTVEGGHEIPTVESDFDVYKAQIADTLAKIQKLPLDELAQHLMTTIDSFGTTSDRANEMIGVIQDDTASVLARMDEILAQAQSLGLVRNTNQTVTDVGTLATDTNAQISVMAEQAKLAVASFERTSTVLQNALDTLNGALSEAEGVIAPDSELSRATLNTLNDVSVAVRDIGATANSIRTLTDYLARNPDSILFGKPAE